MNSINNGIGSVLKQKIKEGGVYQKELADKALVSESAMTGYLKDEHPMPVSVFATIVKELGISADAIINGQEVEASPSTDKKQVSVSDILDALALLLESFEMAIDLKEYEVEETGFFPGRAVVTTDENGEEYIESAFSETKATYYAIGINSRAIQKLLRDWKRKQEVVTQFGKDEAELTKLLFTNEVEQAKQKYDAIEPISGALFKQSKEPIFIDNFRGSIPYELDAVTLHIWDSVFLNNDRGGYEYEGAYFPDYIPNRTRSIVLSRAGCTDKSLDDAITKGDLSLLVYEDELPF